QRGVPERAARLRIPLGTGLVGQVVAEQRPVRSDDMLADPRVWEPQSLSGLDMRSWLGVPLSDAGTAFGGLSVSSSRPGAFGPADEQRLWALAALVGAAVRQARLAAEGQRLAVVEERQKLARELHDSGTQSLFSASLLAQAAQSLWGRDPHKAKERLDRAAELCGGALAEMRALIFELRPAALQEEGLVSALRKHAAAREARDGIV